MNRTLKVKRIFSLGDYNNIEFSDEVTEIPSHIVVSPKGTALLYYLMMLEMEKAHKAYLALYKKFPASREQMDKAAEIIEEERSRTFIEFMEELNKEQIVDDPKNPVSDQN